MREEIIHDLEQLTGEQMVELLQLIISSPCR